ncbi:MAG: ribosome silencing factor [Magnetococcales bacterium]|nr:ribosome silencing factor [Magnetococcales bacterium]
MNSEALAEALKGLLDEKKAEEIALLDLRGRSPLADFFLVANGRSTTHVMALAQEIDRFVHQWKVRVRGIEGTREASWVLVDLGDVVVHLFRAESRKFYDLDRLWSPQTRLLETAGAVKKATLSPAASLPAEGRWDSSPEAGEGETGETDGDLEYIGTAGSADAAIEETEMDDDPEYAGIDESTDAAIEASGKP